MRQGKTRDEIFQKLFHRNPSPEERERFDKMGELMNLHPDDSIWYFILVNELYEDRLATRLKDINGAAGKAADIALEKISGTISDKIEEAAIAKAKASTAKENSILWQSWGFIMSFIVLFGASCTSAGYVMGRGNLPFWLNSSEGGIRAITGYFLNVPSGWIFLLGSTPFLFSQFRTTTALAKIAEKEKKIKLYLQSAGYLLLLIFSVCIMLLFF